MDFWGVMETIDYCGLHREEILRVVLHWKSCPTSLGNIALSGPLGRIRHCLNLKGTL